MIETRIGLAVVVACTGAGMGCGGSQDTLSAAGPETETLPQSVPSVVPAEPAVCVHRDSNDATYPNELPLFQFYKSSRWSVITPLVSTAADVRAALGTPSAENDLADYTAPYPGDAAAAAPVLGFQIDEDWQLLVYFVRSDVRAKNVYPKAYQDKVLSLDLIPNEAIDMSAVSFPAVFESIKNQGADASWTESRDEHGLSYAVYISGARPSRAKAGMLNRISYDPSAAALRASSLVSVRRLQKRSILSPSCSPWHTQSICARFPLGSAS